jgi:Anti-sigma-K factor rskA
VNENEYIQSGAIEACVMGLATAEEMAELELMKIRYPAVKVAADLFEQQLELQALSNAVPPPARVREAVMRETTAAAVIPMQPAVTAAPVRPIWMRYAAAASVALLLGSVTFNLMLARKIKDLKTEVDIAKNTKLPAVNDNNAQFAFMSNPEITPVIMNGVNLHAVCRCTLFWDQDNKKAYLVVHHLVKPPAGKDYQLWAMIDGKPVSAGIINASDFSKPIPLDNIPNGAGGFAVTLEDKGGKPTPTLEEMYLNGKIS